MRLAQKEFQESAKHAGIGGPLEAKAADFGQYSERFQEHIATYSSTDREAARQFDAINFPEVASRHVMARPRRRCRTRSSACDVVGPTSCIAPWAATIVVRAPLIRRRATPDCSRIMAAVLYRHVSASESPRATRLSAKRSAHHLSFVRRADLGAA
jgi:hypothetical protein